MSFSPHSLEKVFPDIQWETPFLQHESFASLPLAVQLLEKSGCLFPTLILEDSNEVPPKLCLLQANQAQLPQLLHFPTEDWT